MQRRVMSVHVMLCHGRPCHVVSCGARTHVCGSRPCRSFHVNVVHHAMASHVNACRHVMSRQAMSYYVIWRMYIMSWHVICRSRHFNAVQTSCASMCSRVHVCVCMQFMLCHVNGSPWYVMSYNACTHVCIRSACHAGSCQFRSFNAEHSMAFHVNACRHVMSRQAMSYYVEWRKYIMSWHVICRSRHLSAVHSSCASMCFF